MDSLRAIVAPLLMTLLILSGCASAPPPPTPTTMFESPSPGSPRQEALAAPVRTSVSDGAEPMIVASADGKFLWIGDTSGAYSSVDQGKTWLAMGGYLGGGSLVFGDGVALAPDGQGHLYAAFLHDNRADVARSDDGKSFTFVSYLSGIPVDRPWLAANKDAVVMIYLNNLGAVGFFEACSRSTDGGSTFLDRSPTAGPSGSGGLVMLPDGSFYFTSQSGAITRHAATCQDAQQTQQVFGTLGVNNFIPLATNGEALFTAASGSKNAIQVAGIPKWGARPVIYTVSPPELATNTFAAVAARGNDVVVAWYGSDKSGDPSANGFTGDFHVYVAFIHDFFGAADGPTIRVARVTSTPNHHGTICMGGVTCTGNRGLLDYFGVTLGPDGRIHVAYVDDTRGQSQTIYAGLDPATLPESGLEVGRPPSGTPSAPVPTGTPVPPGSGPSGAKPVARFTGALDGFTFRADASNSSGEAPLRFTWDWGDGTLGEGMVSEHTYAEKGEVNVTLTVSDASGRSSVARTPLLVNGSGTAEVDAGARHGAPGIPLLVGLAALAAVALLRSRRDPR